MYTNRVDSAKNALIGEEGPEVYWWCTTCGGSGTSRHPDAGELEPGHKMPMGQVFQCTQCKRRGTCNARLPRKGAVQGG